MSHILKYCKLFLSFVTLFSFSSLQSEELKIAVASNFSNTIKKIVQSYKNVSKDKIVLIFGSTGKIYAQIKNGAPFDAFFSADAKTPKLLENEKLTVDKGRFTYAMGKIILWSPLQNFIDPKGAVLKSGQFKYLAIANAKLAPYGRAAKQSLKAMGLFDTLKEKIIRGENISQTFQFIKSRNVELGIISLSQLNSLRKDSRGSWWPIPKKLYSPIVQQVALLKKGPGLSRFIDFVLSKKGRAIIKQDGYDVL